MDLAPVEIDPEEVNNHAIEKWKQPRTVIFMIVLFAIFVLRQCLYDLMWKALDKFYENVEDNYKRCQEDVDDEGGSVYNDESYF